MAKLTDETRASLRRRSRLVNLGRDAEFSQGFINVPPFRGSTVLYPDVATLKNRTQRFTYGTRGTPTTEALCSAWTDLSGAAGTVLVPSGLAAIVVALMTALSAGDHMLMTDSVYQAGARVRRHDFEANGDRDHLLRSHNRRRRRRADAAQHQSRVHRVRRARRPSRSRTFPRSPQPRTRTAPASSWTTPGRRRSSSQPTRTASTWRSKLARNICPATQTCCSASSPPMKEWFERLHQLRPSDGHSRQPRGCVPCAARSAHHGAQATRGGASGAWRWRNG